MRIGIEEIYNILHNHPPEHAALYIREKAENIVGSLYLLDQVIEVKELHKNELTAGGQFTAIFARHSQKKVPDHKVPAIQARAKNFSKAIFKFVVAGFPVATKAEAERKLAICEANVCGYFDGSICRHTRCGCFSKIKTFFETENCPIGKW